MRRDGDDPVGRDARDDRAAGVIAGAVTAEARDEPLHVGRAAEPNRTGMVKQSPARCSVCARIPEIWVRCASSACARRAGEEPCRSRTSLEWNSR